jgi:tetratricopeptide (TPR) repeat protein
MPEATTLKRRKYPRIKVPKGMYVGWKSPGHHTLSHAHELGLGGVFLFTPTPAAVGATIELIFDVLSAEVRARAVVRDVRAGVGMGLQFVQMLPEHRARLNRFLMSQMAPAASSSTEKSTRAAAQPSASSPADQLSFDRELVHLLELTQKGTYYQLLDVTADSTPAQIKRNFYSLARKFHPDHHMDHPELVESLQKLMEVAAQAYQTLADGKRRAVYDKALAASGTFSFHRVRTEAQETIEGCLVRANECLRAQNFVGSILWLRKCVAMAPENARYRALLARSLGTVAQYRDEAAEHFQVAVELDPLNLNVLFQFAELCEEIMLHSRARALYAKILEIDSSHARSLERLAEMNSRQHSASADKVTKSSTVMSRMFGKKS